MDFQKALEERLEIASMQKLETLDATIPLRLRLKVILRIQSIIYMHHIICYHKAHMIWFIRYDMINHNLERCNMRQTAACENTKRCSLDLNFIDWKRFRLGHDSGYDSHYEKQKWDYRTAFRSIRIQQMSFDRRIL